MKYYLVTLVWTWQEDLGIKEALRFSHGKEGAILEMLFCTTCEYKSKRFVSEKAQAHLAGDAKLAKGVVSVLYTQCPGDVRAAMKKLILKVVDKKRKTEQEVVKGLVVNVMKTLSCCATTCT